MSKVEDFLSPTEEQSIVNAIQLAEEQTSGEIRVHLELKSNLDAYQRALEVFFELKMNETQLQNGVLIYVAVQDKKFAICGDKGINEVVSDDFWDNTKNIILENFKNNNFAQGLIMGITEAGLQLQKYFPANERDSNELSNEISKG